MPFRFPPKAVLLIASARLPTDGVPEWNNACVTLRGNIEIVAPPPTIGHNGLALPTGQVQINGIWLSGQIILSGVDACVQVSDSTLIPGDCARFTRRPDAARYAERDGIGCEPALGHDAVFEPCDHWTGHAAINLFLPEFAEASSTPARAYCPAFAGPDWRRPARACTSKTRPLSAASGRRPYGWLRTRSFTPGSAAATRGRLRCGRFNCNRVACVSAGCRPNSITPKRYECLPPDAASQPALEPGFVTLRFGIPGYCLLSGDMPVAIWKGADNGSQIGVYYQIQETEAVTNIEIRSAEFMPVNLEGGVFLIPSRALPEALRPLATVTGRVRRVPTEPSQTMSSQVSAPD